MLDPHSRPVLRDGTLKLRAPVMADVEARLALGSNAEIRHMFGAPLDEARVMTYAMAEDWVEAQLKEPLAFVIEHEGVMIGALRLHTVDRQDRRANLAIAILDPALLDQGIGTRACRLILNYAFEVMGLHRITLRVIEYNARAIAAYKKLGFVMEGREREAALVGDQRHDDIIMGLLAHEWAV